MLMNADALDACVCCSQVEELNAKVLGRPSFIGTRAGRVSSVRGRYLHSCGRETSQSLSTITPYTRLIKVS